MWDVWGAGAMWGFGLAAECDVGCGRPQLQSCTTAATSQPSSGSFPVYLLRSVHAVPGFVFQEVLFSKVTFATFGTLKWLLSSVFPRGIQPESIRHGRDAQRGLVRTRVRSGNGEGMSRWLLDPFPNASIQSPKTCPRFADPTGARSSSQCPLHCHLFHTAPHKPKLLPSLQAPPLLCVINPDAPVLPTTRAHSPTAGSDSTEG